MEGRTQEGNRGQRELVCEQPGTEVDDSYHYWRVPSKWNRGKARGIHNKGTAPCIYVTVLYVQGTIERLNDTSYCVYNNNQNECC